MAGQVYSQGASAITFLRQMTSAIEFLLCMISLQPWLLIGFPCIVIAFFAIGGFVDILEEIVESPVDDFDIDVDGDVDGFDFFRPV